MEEQRGRFWGSSTDRRPDSSSSTPYESAECSPRMSTDAALSCFLSATPTNSSVKVTLDLDSLPSTGMGFVTASSSHNLDDPGSDDFDFSARFSETDLSWSPAPMSSADELFCNGQIRPLWYTSGDPAHWYSAPLEHNDDDCHFDFQSSADYKFTMLSLSLTHISAMSKLEQYVGYDFSGHSHDRVCLHGPENDLSMEDAIKYNDAGVQVTTESLHRQDSRRRDSNMTAKHFVKIKVEESRGRSAGGTKEGVIRRSRSLSPMRVFHMDDELPKQSFEARQSSQPEKEGHHSIEQEEKWEQVKMARGKGGRMTLKDLLHASEQAEQAAFSERRSRTGSKEQATAQFKTTLNERSTRRWSKSSRKHSLQNKLEVPNHSIHIQGPRSSNALHFSSPRVQSEQMRQQTFLPYRRGLLGCLGFTSKSYRCVAGFRSLHSKSQGTS